jgi:hypothetical protein
MHLLRWRYLSKGDVSSGCFALSGTIDAGNGLQLLRFILDGWKQVTGTH